MNALLRAKSILTDPVGEWDRIARETDDPAAILTHYVALLATIPSLFGFIDACLIGVVTANGTILRTPLVDGVFGAIFGYVMACAIALVLALGIYVLVPIFGGRRGFDNAFRGYENIAIIRTGIFKGSDAPILARSSQAAIAIAKLSAICSGTFVNRNAPSHSK